MCMAPPGFHPLGHGEDSSKRRDRQSLSGCYILPELFTLAEFRGGLNCFASPT